MVELREMGKETTREMKKKRRSPPLEARRTSLHLLRSQRVPDPRRRRRLDPTKKRAIGRLPRGASASTALHTNRLAPPLQEQQPRRRAAKEACDGEADDGGGGGGDDGALVGWGGDCNHHLRVRSAGDEEKQLNNPSTRKDSNKD